MFLHNNHLYLWGDNMANSKMISLLSSIINSCKTFTNNPLPRTTVKFVTVLLLRKASAARVNRRLRRYYLIVRLLPNVFALACRS